jgi:hypothetical protein
MAPGAIGLSSSISVENPRMITAPRSESLLYFRMTIEAFQALNAEPEAVASSALGGPLQLLMGAVERSWRDLTWCGGCRQDRES